MFRGVFTALVTPFNKNLTIDEKALEALVEFQIEQGINGLVPVGTTGESPTLNHEEHLRVIEIVVKKSAGRVPVIAGTGSNSTDEAIEYTKSALAIGADASLQVAPYYNKPTQEGLYRHFSAIADAVDMPLVVYNIPGRSSVNIEGDTLLRLAEHPNIQAVKEASGSFPQIMDVISRKKDDFAVLSGDDNFAVTMTLMGGSGLVSVASNAIPGKMKTLIDTALDGNAKKAV
ncbi:MAG: 4-hydroxy-tetrahydrodipicolinate synthase, partial [Spirochaetales bacterium]|nr:4-hydroxy-tetrahydrodipicolinate synthase [Spirochaetales bacterium]